MVSGKGDISLSKILSIFVEVKVPWDIVQLEDATTVVSTQVENVPVVK